jgi:hypothetical protein
MVCCHQSHHPVIRYLNGRCHFETCFINERDRCLFLRVHSHPLELTLLPYRASPIGTRLPSLTGSKEKDSVGLFNQQGRGERRFVVIEGSRSCITANEGPS